MEKFLKPRTLVAWLACLLLCTSCAVDQHFEFPQGPEGQQGEKGTAGLSAYDVWLEMIRDNPDYTGGYDPEDFFLYLKGDKGEQGENADLADLIGENGLSAYEVWLDYIATTEYVEDPTIPGEQPWNKENTSEDYFWRFLTGADGLTAYELWVIDVTDEDGLAHPKYPNTNAKWPTSQVDQEDFWEYLKGLDGEDGQNGVVFPIMDGHYNVIVEYTQFEYGEFVNVNDGSVTFTVYGKDGEPLKGATVTQMPGIPDLEFTSSLDDGTFTISREQLPRDVDQEYRYGTAFVQAAGQPEGEQSASNTYVPERMDIRLRLRGAVTLASGAGAVGVTKYPVVVERREAVGEDWEVIPDYLENRTQPVKFYWVTGQNDYAIPAADSRFSFDIVISSPAAVLEMPRPKVASPYYVDTWEKSAGANSQLYGWDGTSVQYFVAQLEGYYGTPAQLVEVANLGEENEKDKPVVSQRVPIQRAPMIQNVSMGDKNEHDIEGYPDYTMSASGSFETSGVEYEYFYNPILTKDTDSDTHVWIYPTIMDPVEVDKIKVFQVRFQRTLATPTGDQTATATSNAVTLADTDWSISSNVFDGGAAHIVIPASGVNLFFGSSTNWSNFGEVSFDQNKILSRDANVYNVGDITITFDE